MTVEELLKPRWKVIADYPKSLYHVGDILNGGWRSEDLIYCDTDGPRWSHYPHLFRKMQWWEEISEQDLPKYVKFINDTGTLDFVIEVEGWLYHNKSSAVWAFKYLWENEPDIKRMSLNGWLPATKHEYDVHCQTVS